MNSSSIFNKMASAKNFERSGNRVTSRQPGKPFASAEALNYIPVGYNTSGGNQFRHGSIALNEKLLGGKTNTGVRSELIRAGFDKDIATAQSLRLNRLYKTEGIDAVQEELTRIKGNLGKNRGEAGYVEGTKYGNGGSVKAEAAELKRVLNFTKKAPQEFKDHAEKLRVEAVKVAKEKRLKDLADESNAKKGKNYGRTPTRTGATELEKYQIPSHATGSSSPIRAPGASTTGGNGKLGQSMLDGADNWWKSIGAEGSEVGKGIGRGKYAFAAAAGVAGLVAGGVALNQLSGSKRNPVGSAITLGVVGGAVGVGLKYGSKAIMEHAAPATNTAFHGTLTRMAGMRGGKIAAAAGLAGAVGLGLGMGRNITGI